MSSIGIVIPILLGGSRLRNKNIALIDGQPLPANKSQWKEIVSKKEFTITLDLKMKKGTAEIWTNDLSEEYVNFNKSE